MEYDITEITNNHLSKLNDLKNSLKDLNFNEENEEKFVNSPSLIISLFPYSKNVNKTFDHNDENVATDLKPITSEGYNHEFSTYELRTYYEVNGIIVSEVKIDSKGILISFDTFLLKIWNGINGSNKKQFFFHGLKKYLQVICKYIIGLKNLDITPPYALFLDIINIKDFNLIDDLNRSEGKFDINDVEIGPIIIKENTNCEKVIVSLTKLILKKSTAPDYYINTEMSKYV